MSEKRKRKKTSDQPQHAVEVEILEDELPEGWLNARIEAIAQLNPRHPNTLNETQMVSFVPMPSVRECAPDLDLSNEKKLLEVRKGYTHFADGDVLFAKITPCMENGKGAVATGLKNGLGCGTTELHVIRPLACIDPYYVYRFLQQDWVRRNAAANFTGSAGQLRVPSSFISELELPLPPVSEQKRIVAKLEELLGRVSRAKARLDRIPALLKRFRQSVLAAACSGKLTADWREMNEDVEHSIVLLKQIDLHRNTEPVERLAEEDFPEGIIPDTWTWVRFGSVIGELRNGVSNRPNVDPPGTPILRISAARPGAVDLTDFRFMPDGERFMPLYTLRDGDLLFTRYNGSLELLGVCGMVRALGMRTVLYPDKLMRVRFDHNLINPSYAEVFFQVTEVHERIIAKSKSSAGQNGVSGTDIKNQPFAIPPLSEQHEIVRRVEQAFAFADQIEARLTKAQAQVDRLTQSILAKAFRGELVPTEAELARREGRDYEPASKLLERVRASRTAEVGAGKTRRNQPKTGSKVAP